MLGNGAVRAVYVCSVGLCLGSRTGGKANIKAVGELYSSPCEK